ncbi:hypothetical protein SIID45300_01408 [Candidatus Magnetaquicoccaceae bacterium FCR-1]|uniref:Uncharacterized protein n=1 Tax=Candidatus Magnetaquiglobus chichijimensis TaxID=3141448 RepID=A0ABQ0C872_9PROT
MPKIAGKLTEEILDQATKARQALDALERLARNDRGEFADPAAVRAQLNAAQAHVMRATEKTRTLR